jgi:HK97 family phage prohead protease
MPPEIKGMETRTWTLENLNVEERADEPPVIVGHAAVFNKLSVDLGGYRERIRRGAFGKTIIESDVRALFNHDANIVLGRVKSGTLQLREDDTGLLIRAYPPNTQLVQDMVLTPMRRGDVSQMSFMFQTMRQEWIEDLEKKEFIRELVEVRLFDVSPVTFPAYEGTDVAVRSALAAVGVDTQALAQAIERSKAGGITPDDQALVRSVIEALNAIAPAAPTQEGHPADDAEAIQRAQARQRWLKRELELLALE